MTNKLGMLGATWNAVWGKSLDYYPRRPDAQIPSRELVSDISKLLQKVNFSSTTDAKIYIDQAKESLNEVKQLTEYQDQKTARLLTIMAFLTAAAGAMFSKILDIYPLHLPVQGWSAEVLVPLMYALFGIYILFVSVGALICFHAMQTRFFLPTDHDTVTGEDPKSFLFFKYIMTTEPAKWGAKFSSPTVALLAEYYKNYVLESYLIAVKIGDKIRYLEPAQRLLQWAIRVLVLWIISVAIMLCVVPYQSTQKPPGGAPVGQAKSG
jgi:hypothetical protein